MTLALVGPWAWAELGDPPPGEPTPPPPGEPPPPPPGQPSGPPTPPPPPPPPPPEPGGTPPDYIPPAFDWHGYGPLIAVWDADLKLSSPHLTDEDTDCGRATAVGGNWPFTTMYTPSGGFDEAVEPDWSLNDPARTYELMQRNNIGLYLHDGGAGTATGTFDGVDQRCDWLSLAALNDLLEAAEPVLPSTFTGLILGRIEPSQRVFGALEATEVDLCYYRDWIARARTEAYNHPHHKLVIVDELTYMLASPFQLWFGQTNPWGTSDLEVVRRLATEADAAAPGSQRAACDAVWTGVLGATDPVADGWLPPASADQSPVELWGRIAAPHVPLYLLPSMMLGRVAAPSGTFVTGESYVGRWTASPQVLEADAPDYRLRLQYFATPYAPINAPLALSAWVNGVELPASVLATNESFTAAKRADRKNIYQVDVEVSAPGAPGGWLRGPLAANQIDLRVTNLGDPAEDYDNAFLVWGARLIYQDAAGTPIHTQLLRPEDATGVHRTSGGVEGPCAKPEICEDNSAYRINHLLDGVSIAADTDLPWPDPGDWDHVDPALTWTNFMKHSCQILSTSGPDGGRVRCLVDERVWVSDEAKWGDNLRLDEAVSRLAAGHDVADGASVTWLVMELEDMVEGVGRFGAREPFDEAYPYLAYLPRLSRNMLGEGITFQIDTAGDPSCAGEWTVNWRMPGCPDKWTYGPVGEIENSMGDWVDRLDSLDLYAFYQLIEVGTGQDCGSVSGPFTGAFTVEVLPDDLGMRFGWEIKDDTLVYTVAEARDDVGFSQGSPKYVEFGLEPPDNCESYTVGQRAIWDADYFDYYETVTCLMREEGDVEVCL
jgi:hypothetical protein